VPKSIYSLSAQELAPDIRALLLLYRKGELREAVVRQVLKGACWWVSNAQGRKDSCDSWSKAALEARKGAPEWGGLGLIHEHIVPRSVIEESIIGLKEPSVERIAELLSFSRICVVTPEEDESLRKAGLGSVLPAGVGLSEAELTRRHKEVGIEWADEAFRPRKA
jgi:hypothetical protein